MTKHFPIEAFAEALPLRRNRGDRVFDLHPAIFAVTLGAYMAYLGIMAAVFMNRELVLPFVIFAITVLGMFIVPGLWQRVAPRPEGRVQDWGDFLREGIETHTGHLGAKGALAQVLIMPAMLVGWGLVIAVIRATV